MASFVLHVVVGFARSGDALKDPGVGWHLQAGRLMLASWSVPHVDVFSYTAAGRPWVDYYWLFELVSAACERHAELRCDRPRAAVGRIAGDADSHAGHPAVGCSHSSAISRHDGCVGSSRVTRCSSR